jgi:hypothetical protein
VGLQKIPNLVFLLIAPLIAQRSGSYSSSQAPALRLLEDPLWLLFRCNCSQVSKFEIRSERHDTALAHANAASPSNELLITK